MQTKDILALEKAGEGRIVLHKGGIFWRAHQYSAFLFSKHIRPPKVNTRFVKVVGRENLLGPSKNRDPTRALGVAGVELNPSYCKALCPSFLLV